MQGLSELATRINAEHEQVVAALKGGVEHARNAGLLLMQAKQQLHHGAWIPWIKTNLSIVPRTAQRYIRVAERWAEIEANATPVSHLSYKEALSLIAEKGPDGDEPAVLDAANATPVTHLDPAVGRGGFTGTARHRPQRARRDADLGRHGAPATQVGRTARRGHAHAQHRPRLLLGKGVVGSVRSCGEVQCWRSALLLHSHLRAGRLVRKGRSARTAPLLGVRAGLDAVPPLSPCAGGLPCHSGGVLHGCFCADVSRQGGVSQEGR